ncbi:HAAS signaling domain-containing protein [Sedimentibacter sp.]|uniref:DUF1700 domain-containing protein n=1 Tax=Sedimentibacter sp. TaxID=1960295 RepID=UPI0028AEFF29|nr:DUF1700 domain-containing protein [Sedimentibacter sp.]
MREEYIKKVKKELSVSRNQKREIIRDLNEAFDSAKEHGETEKQVIDRLGTPKDFAESMEETVGFNRAQYKKRRKKLLAVYCSCGIALLCLITALVAKHSALPDNVTGQADAMTQITVNGFWPFDIWSAMLIIGLAFAITAVVLIVGLVRKKK